MAIRIRPVRGAFFLGLLFATSSALAAPEQEAELSPWVPVRLDLARPTGVCAHGGRVWVAGAGGTLGVSADRGASFQPVATGTRLELFDVHAADGLVVAVGDRGTVRVSRDGGSRWSAPESGTEAWLDAVWGSGDALYAVGDAATIVRSLDRGASWQVVHSGLAQDALTDVWGVGGVVLAVGQHGAILRSADRGKTWRSVSSGTGVMLHAVWGASARQIYVAGHDRLLLSRDGGKSFRATGRPAGETPLTALAGQGKSLWLAGAHGEVWRSDSGKRWTHEREPDAGGGDVVALASLGSELYAVQEGMGLMRRLASAGDCTDWPPLPALAGCQLVQPRAQGQGSMCPARPGAAALTVGDAEARRTVVGAHQLLRYRCSGAAPLEAARARLTRGGFTLAYSAKTSFTASKGAAWAEVRKLPGGYQVEVVAAASWARVPEVKALGAALAGGWAVLYGVSARPAGDGVAEEALARLAELLRADRALRVALAGAGPDAADTAKAARSWLLAHQVAPRQVDLSGAAGAPGLSADQQAAPRLEVKLLPSRFSGSR